MAHYISISLLNYKAPDEDKYDVIPVLKFDTPDWQQLSQSPNTLIIHIIGRDITYIRTLKTKPNEKPHKHVIAHRSMATPIPVPPKKEKPGQGILNF